MIDAYPHITAPTRIEIDSDTGEISFFSSGELKVKIGENGIQANKLFAQDGVLTITNNDSNGRIEIKNDSGECFIGIQGGDVTDKNDQLLLRSPQIVIKGLKPFTDQAAAEAGGLEDTYVYRTGTDPKIVVQ